MDPYPRSLRLQLASLVAALALLPCAGADAALEKYRLRRTLVLNLASLLQRDTVDPPLYSEAYDLGTWSFHGTGFTATPFLELYLTHNFGNSMQMYSGRRIVGPGVPLLPVAGLVAIGTALAVGAARALRHHRR